MNDQNSYIYLGSLNGTAEPVDEGCQFNSCPPNSPAIGQNDTDPRLNYVNAYPVTAMSYGISTLCPEIFRRAPDFAVSGPNVGGLIRQKFTQPHVLIHHSKPRCFSPIFWNRWGCCRSCQLRDSSSCVQWSNWFTNSLDGKHTLLFQDLCRTCNQYHLRITQFQFSVPAFRRLAQRQFPGYNIDILL